MSIISTWRRRYAHPGVYLYRTRRHMRPGTEWGYAGKSRSLELRSDCHEGRCTRHPGCAGGKPWSDLVVRRHTLELPWWLGFDWITLSLETVLIWVTRPRYNLQKNPRRNKTGTSLQLAQRRAREISPNRQDSWQSWSLGYAIVKYAGALMIIIGGVGWWLTR
jgi:hypothetical protein